MINNHTNNVWMNQIVQISYFSRGRLAFLTERTLALILFFLFLLFSSCFVFFLCDPTLVYDETEQIVYAQHLSIGYPAQPPLYTWLQWLIVKCFGTSLFSIAVLKFTLYGLCLYQYYLVCRIYLRSNQLTWAAVAAWVLLPHIGFDFLIHKTHGILVLTLCISTWLWWLKEKQTCSYYVILGLLIGLGFNSKFNYILFLTLLICSSLPVNPFRKKLFHPYILVSMLVALCLVFPYMHWLMHNKDLGLSALYQLQLNQKTFWVGLFSLLKSSLLFIIPSLIIFLFFTPKIQKDKSPALILLNRYHILALPFLLIFILVSQTSNIRSHWLVPLFFYVAPVGIYFYSVFKKT